jgi:hypothetical protein
MTKRKRCVGCKKRKVETAFYLWADGRRASYCITCESERAKTRRREGGAEFRRKEAERLNSWRATRRQVIQEAKSKPCADCHKPYPYYVMDFDHVGEGKVADINALMRNGASLGCIMAEIAKCDVVCANCHRERTHARSSAA